jgi:hypothetical protein
MHLKELLDAYTEIELLVNITLAEHSRGENICALPARLDRIWRETTELMKTSALSEEWRIFDELCYFLEDLEDELARRGLAFGA